MYHVVQFQGWMQLGASIQVLSSLWDSYAIPRRLKGIVATLAACGQAYLFPCSSNALCLFAGSRELMFSSPELLEPSELESRCAKVLFTAPTLYLAKPPRGPGPGRSCIGEFYPCGTSSAWPACPEQLPISYPLSSVSASDDGCRIPRSFPADLSESITSPSLSSSMTVWPSLGPRFSPRCLLFAKQDGVGNSPFLCKISIAIPNIFASTLSCAVWTGVRGI